MMMKGGKLEKVYIVSYSRTPIGCYQGCLTPLSAVDLAAIVIRDCVSKIPGYLHVDQVILGNCLSAGLGQCPSTQACLKAGLPPTTISYTLNKVCSSGMKSITSAAESIALGKSSLIIAGGMESMSNVPHYLFPNQGSQRCYGNMELVDGLVLDGLKDCGSYQQQHQVFISESLSPPTPPSYDIDQAFVLSTAQGSSSESQPNPLVYSVPSSRQFLYQINLNRPTTKKPFLMGHAAQLAALKNKISRKAQDDYSIESYQRALKSHALGFFLKEIVPISVQKNKNSPPIVILEDENLKKYNKEKLMKLSPCFPLEDFLSSESTHYSQSLLEEFSLSPGNSSALSDGAAAVVLMSGSLLESLAGQVSPLAEICHWNDVNQAPMDFVSSPALGIRALLKTCPFGVELKDIDYFEINEAFSIVPLISGSMLSPDFPMDRLNVAGGAVSLGHPLGCSGTRIVGSLCRILLENNGKLGVAAICNGGGGASCMLIKSCATESRS